MGRYFLAFYSIILTLGLLIGDVPPVCSQEDEFTLEEITVTAEKRETELQKTSMAITVVTGEDLLETRTESLHDILKEVPNLITTAQGSGFTISLRGLGQDLPPELGEASVAMQFDGAHQMRPEPSMFGYFDVDRVEVLRGPQGTLYGRNATGGVVNVISTKPRAGVTEGYASIEVGNYNLKQGESAVNVPISDKFASRVSFVINKVNSQTEDDTGWRATQTSYATRAQLRYQPSDDVSVNLMTNYTQRMGSRLMTMVGMDNYDADRWINTDTTPWNRTQNSIFKNHKLQLNAEFPLGPGVVTFIPNYDRINERSSSMAIDRMTGEPIVPPELRTGGRYSFETTTVELRYAAKSDATVQWIGGLYWTDTNEPGGPRRTQTEIPPQLKWSKAYAIFGQATYPFSETLRGIVGARYDKDQKGYERILDIPPPYPQSNSFKFTYFDWKLGVEMDHSEDMMSYFTVATGHRPGGYAEFTGKTFDTESLISAEYGLKSRFMDKRLQVNSSIFYYDYKGYQAADTWLEWDEDVNNYVMVSEFFNVDKAQNFGVEIETKALLTRNTTLDLAVTYLKNEYKSDFFVHESPLEPAASNQKGMPFPQSPEFTFKGSIDHAFLFSWGDSLKPRISARWTDERYIEVFISPKTLAPAYTIVDASLTYSSINNWTLNFYANNALDEKYATAQRLQPPPGQYFVGLRREVGVTFNIRF